VQISHEGWFAQTEQGNVPVDKNDFSCTCNGQRTVFQFAYITIHGAPGEDGKLQGYLDMLQVPYSCCDVLASALTFDKYVCNRYLSHFGIRVADAVLLKKGEKYSEEAIGDRLGFPLFVKPNTGGSSFATTKVKELCAMQPAIELAFGEADEVLLESFLQGTEVTCGCYKIGNEIRRLPLSEVVSRNEFFDYNAKYRGEVQEITPARLPDEMTVQIQDLTAKIYELTGAAGIIRADFIIADNQPFLLEVNTTPGMTATSFIPQQVAAAGLSIKNVLTEIIEDSYERNRTGK
jgi:D-alanine-D-alanine ligase